MLDISGFILKLIDGVLLIRYPTSDISLKYFFCYLLDLQNNRVGTLNERRLCRRDPVTYTNITILFSY